MFCECQALIKSIDAYIKKKDDTLADSLKKAGFALPEKTVKNIEELEEKLAEIFQEQSFNVEELLKEAERNGVGLEDLIEGEWQGFKVRIISAKNFIRYFSENCRSVYRSWPMSICLLWIQNL